MRLNNTVMISLAILTLPAVAWPKGETTQIEIEGGDLASPIEITDPAIVSKFSIWNGPFCVSALENHDETTNPILFSTLFGRPTSH